MKKKAALALAAAMLLAVTQLAGCGGSGGSDKKAADSKGASAKQVETLKVGISAWPKNLDPVVKMGKTSTPIITQIFDTLLYIDNENKLTSYICESWKKIDDTTTEYKLKKGITFQNGDPLTAKDVKFSYERVLNDKSGYVDPNVRAVIGTIAGVEAVDDLTVRIKTKRIDPIIFNRVAARLGVYIVPEGYYNKVGKEKFGTQPVGTGPYKVTGITPEKLQLAYYDKYYGKKPVASKIEYRFIKEDTAIVTALTNGEIDIVPSYLSISAADMLKNVKNVKVMNLPSATSHLLRFNTNNPVTNNKKLRQALSLAIDRKMLADTLWKGYASVPNGYNYPEFGQYYIKDYKTYEYNPEKAKQLVKESGYKGETVSYQLIPGYYPLATEVGESIVDMWKKIGVNAKVENVDAIKPATIKNVANWSNGLRYSDPLGGLWVLWGEGTAIQKAAWKAPARFNELGHQLEVEPDVTKRNAVYKEMLQIWDEEVPGTILFCPNEIGAVREGLEWSYKPGLSINFREGYLKTK